VLAAPAALLLLNRRPAVVRPRDDRVAPLPVPVRSRSAPDRPRDRAFGEARSRPPLPALLRQLRSAPSSPRSASSPWTRRRRRSWRQVGNRVFDADAATRLYHETEAIPSSWWRRCEPRARATRLRRPGGGLSAFRPARTRVIAGRLAQLSDHARGRRRPRRDRARLRPVGLVRLVGDEDAVVGALDELWRKRIVREQGPNAYDLHSRQAAGRRLRRDERPPASPLHRRVAEALVPRTRRTLDPVSAQIAAHYEEAPASWSRRSPLLEGSGRRPGDIRPRRSDRPRRPRLVAARGSCPRAPGATAGSSISSSSSPRATG